MSESYSQQFRVQPAEDASHEDIKFLKNAITEALDSEGLNAISEGKMEVEMSLEEMQDARGPMKEARIIYLTVSLDYYTHPRTSEEYVGDNAESLVEVLDHLDVSVVPIVNSVGPS